MVLASCWSSKLQANIQETRILTELQWAGAAEATVGLGSMPWWGSWGAKSLPPVFKKVSTNILIDILSSS